MIDIGYVGAFAGGLLALLSPCSVLLLPAFFAFAFDGGRTMLTRLALFGAGLLMTLLPLGVAAGTLGVLLQQHRTTLVAVAAGLVIALGLAQVAGLPIPGIPRSGRSSSSPLGIFALGAVYGVAGVCAGPVLGTVLTVAATRGDPIEGGLLMSVYAAGMLMPLLVLVLLWRRLGDRLRRLLRPRIIRIGRWQNSVVVVISGVVSIAIGAVLLLTDGTASLGGVLGATDQASLEHGVLAATANANDVLAVASIAILVVLGLAISYYRARRHERRAPDPESLEERTP